MSKLIRNFNFSVNNLTILFYVFDVIFISLIYNNPIISGCLFVVLVITARFIRGDKFVNFLKFSIIIFILTFAFNVVINQRGSQIVFQIPFLKVTSESVLNGTVLGVSFLNILWSFYIYDAMTHTKIIFDLLSKFFRSIAIIFILTVKFIPKIVDIFNKVKLLYKFRNNNAERKTNLVELSKQSMFLSEIVLNKSIANFMNMSDVLQTKGYGSQHRLRAHQINRRSDYFARTIFMISLIFNIVMLIKHVGRINFGSANVNIQFSTMIIATTLICSVTVIYPLMIGGIHYLWWKLFASKTTVSNIQIAKKFR
ncbi:energy-coupling factor transporter transmembrane component T [Companilactobacillus mishanensis]|uniref:Energy-coupling factor transporter transmembrane protein EcfT n=1 Tax=Companilactobacillus mishanensis TaxID=2486008 RepID=A0ABW9P9Z6_9LACO|nr:energy-coupling factor transporter transmembrane component T [Companilactobacillus mishanensis]MQS45968.1 hypothetical protein [Companilactobacillus mishanensis]